MKRLMFLGLFSLVLGFAAIGAQESSKVVLRKYLSTPPKVFQADRAQLQKTPEWIPDKGVPPPLPIERAVTIAKDWAKKKFPKFDDVQVRSIELNRVEQWSGVKDRWFYIVDFFAVVDGKPLVGGDMTVFILMDGSVLESETEKDS